MYVIGSNVNGHEWVLAAADCKMTDKGNGIYEWDGEVLGSGFKFNDGTWDNPDLNIGGTSGYELMLGEPYYYAVGGSCGNIALGENPEVYSPHVVLNLNDATVTVTGEGGGEVAWYIEGINGRYEFADDLKFSLGDDGLYTIKGLEITEPGNLKISDNGWAHQYGTYDTEAVFFDLQNMSRELIAVDGEAGNVPYAFIGTFDVTWNPETLVLTFSGQGEEPTPQEPDYYVIGSDVNGKVWSLKEEDAKMTKVNEGIYEWTGTTLGTEFKINNGTWTNAYTFGAATTDPIALDTPVEYVVGEASVNFTLSAAVSSPKVVLNLTTKTVTVSDSANGINAVEVAEGEAVYYNLQGARVANPENGIFVRVANGKAVKVVK